MAGSENKDDSEIVYYYSREHRLARASAAVRELNDGKSAGTGFVRRAAGTKGNLFMLAAILIVCAALVFTSRGSRFDNREFLLDGNTVSFRIESAGADSLILHISKKTPEAESGAYTGAVDLAISPVITGSAGTGEAAPIMNHRVFFTFAGTENYAVVLPFSGETFLIVIQTERERAVRRISRSPRDNTD
jgi:hypothetical protein